MWWKKIRSVYGTDKYKIKRYQPKLKPHKADAAGNSGCSTVVIVRRIITGDSIVPLVKSGFLDDSSNDYMLFLDQNKLASATYFNNKIDEELDNVENELAAKNVKDEMQINRAITKTINFIVTTFQKGRSFYLQQLSTLSKDEEQFIIAVRLAAVAAYHCRFGMKEAIEKVVSLNSNDVAVVKFMEKRPLRLTLTNFVSHQDSAALSVLLPFFDKHFDNLSPENKNDYLILKAHAEEKMGRASGKEEEEDCFTNMLSIISRDAKAGIIKVSDNGIVINKNDNTVENTPAVIGMRL